MIFYFILLFIFYLIYYFFRRIDCQIVGGDRTGSGISGLYSTDNISGISTFDPEEWSFSDLRSSGVQSLHLQADRSVRPLFHTVHEPENSGIVRRHLSNLEGYSMFIGKSLFGFKRRPLIPQFYGFHCTPQ